MIGDYRHKKNIINHKGGIYQMHSMSGDKVSAILDTAYEDDNELELDEPDYEECVLVHALNRPAKPLMRSTRDCFGRMVPAKSISWSIKYLCTSSFSAFPFFLT